MKKSEDIIIQCPHCEWGPDGEIYWACSCGYAWNTFETKGKCPNCKKQWADTMCPGCGKMPPHNSWYKTQEEIKEIENSGNPVLRAKKKSLESRLINYGIKNHRVSYLPYLDHSKEKLQTPYHAGCRMMIMYSISYLVHYLDERPFIMEWLKAENLWGLVSPSEKEFFINPSPDQQLLMDLSWRIESALTLGWCLNKVNDLPKLDIENNDSAIEEFQATVPELGSPLMYFFSTLTYRNLEEIHEEKLLNEIATTYFRDLLLSGKKDETKINRFVSYQRHQVLNWLGTTYVEGETTGELWDEVDTST